MTNQWQRLRQATTAFARKHLWLGMLASAGLVSVLLFATGPVPVAEKLEEKAWPVSVVSVEPAPLRPSFRAYGRVESRNLARMSADLFAVIKAIHVKEGDRVRAGTVLVELDDGELALDVAARKAELSERSANVRSIRSELAHLQASDSEHRSMMQVASAKLTRHQELLGNRLISQSLYDEVLRQTNQVKIDYQDHSQRLADLPNRLEAAQALQARAQAALSRAKLTASKTQLLAPFDGIVLSVPAALGARAQPGTPLVSVADANAYEVRIPVPPAHASEFQQHAAMDSSTSPKAQTQVLAHLADGTELTFSRLAGAVKSGQTSADALFAWPRAKGQPLPVGTTVELQVQLAATKQLVALPAQALYENQRVYLVEEERLRPVRVQRVGETQSETAGHQVLVHSTELLAGSRVITTQLPKAIAGLKVATVNELDTKMVSETTNKSKNTAVAKSNAAQADDALEKVRAEQAKVRAEAIKQAKPAQISLSSNVSNTGGKDSKRRSSRRYRMM